MTDPTKIFPKEDKCLSLDVMMDYLHDRLSNKERNHVERHTLHCEFCSEAMEGLAMGKEDTIKDIIASINEVNHLESQILLSASLEEPVSEIGMDEVVEFSKNEVMLEEVAFSMAPAAAPMRRKEISIDAKAKPFVLKDNQTKFNWTKIAAAITGFLLLGGSLFFILKKNWTKDQPVASVKKSEANSKDDNALINADSAIAIAPLQKEPLQRNQNYSDGVLIPEVPEEEIAAVSDQDADVQQQAKGIREIQEHPVITEQAKELSAPATQEANQLSEEVHNNFEYKSETIEEITQKNSKSRKLEAKKKAAVPAAADVVIQDSAFIANGNSKRATGFAIGLNLYNKGEYKKACIHFLDVKKSDPDYEEARWYLAKSYTATGEKEKAKEVYLELIEMKGKFKEQAEEELGK
jgi:tetratricopeptide (TPR) repeat protein